MSIKRSWRITEYPFLLTYQTKSKEGLKNKERPLQLLGLLRKQSNHLLWTRGKYGTSNWGSREKKALSKKSKPSCRSCMRSWACAKTNAETFRGREMLFDWKTISCKNIFKRTIFKSILHMKKLLRKSSLLLKSTCKNLKRLRKSLKRRTRSSKQRASSSENCKLRSK
jgi:hypothetical protein